MFHFFSGKKRKTTDESRTMADGRGLEAEAGFNADDTKIPNRQIMVKPPQMA